MKLLLNHHHLKAVPARRREAEEKQEVERRRREARREASIQADQQKQGRLESEFGPVLDSLSDSEQNELITQVFDLFNQKRIRRSLQHYDKIPKHDRQQLLEHLASLSDNNFRTVTTILNSFERVMQPKRLRDITREMLSRYQEELRNQNLAESTIKGRLVRIQAALNWAHEMGMVTSVPKILRIKRAKNSKLMKGRPITTEEFERMLSKIPNVVTGGIDSLKRQRNIFDSWAYYLQGLWFSGLRLAESLELWWDRDDRLCINLSGRRPMMCIPAELEKGHEDRLLPMTPDFAEFLLATPPGPVNGASLSAPDTAGKRKVNP